MSHTEQIKAFVKKYYYYLGINKQQEITRLSFEIAKRERIDYTKVAEGLPKPPVRFSEIKNYLVRRRYPSFTKTGQGFKPSFFRCYDRSKTEGRCYFETAVQTQKPVY